MEYLYAQSEAPPIEIMIDGLEVLCPELNCDYTYTANVGIITSQSVSSKSVSIIGTELPTENVRVKFGGVECAATTIVASDTSISCELSSYPESGSWIVEVIGQYGKVVIDEATVTAIDISLIVGSISPSTLINQNGGDTFVIQGQGFSANREQMNVQFSDGTSCNITTSSDTQLECVADEFDVNTMDTASAYTV